MRQRIKFSSDKESSSVLTKKSCSGENFISILQIFKNLFHHKAASMSTGDSRLVADGASGRCARDVLDAVAEFHLEVPCESFWASQPETVESQKSFLQTSKGYLQNGASVDALVELIAVQVVWVVDNASGQVIERAVKVVGVFDFWSWREVGSLWAQNWAAWWHWRQAHGGGSGAVGIDNRVAVVHLGIPVLTGWAADLVGVSAVTLQELSAVGVMGEVGGLGGIFFHRAATVAFLGGGESNQQNRQQ